MLKCVAVCRCRLQNPVVSREHLSSQETGIDYCFPLGAYQSETPSARGKVLVEPIALGAQINRSEM